MKLTIHIGHYKTGSTAIQTHFDSHRGAYKRRGLLYPKAGKPLRKKMNHSALAYQELFQAGQPIGKWYKRSKEFRRYKRGEQPPAREQILDEVKRNRPDHVVLSSEEFIRFGGRRGVPMKTAKGLLDDFSPDEIHIVCYLRRPDRYLESWYNQLVKLGQSPPRLAESLDRYIGSVHVQFFDAVSFWSNLTGKERLTLRRYDDVRDNLLDNTLEAIGVPDITRLERRKPPESDVNPRVPDQFVEFARAFNQDRRPKGARKLRPVLARLARDPEIGGVPVYFLDTPARKQLLETFRPIDRQLAALAGTGETFFPDLDEMMYIDPDAISDVEAFERWGMLAFSSMRDEFDEAQRRASSEEPELS